MEIRKYSFKVIGDGRGDLVAIEGCETIPFAVKRIYYIYHVQDGVVRGQHAHISLQQVLLCVSGSCTILLDDGVDREEVRLSRPNEGLHVGVLTWREMKDFSEDAVLLVLASEHYDENDYIRNYEDFLSIARSSEKRG